MRPLTPEGCAIPGEPDGRVTWGGAESAASCPSREGLPVEAGSLLCTDAVPGSHGVGWAAGWLQRAVGWSGRPPLRCAVQLPRVPARCGRPRNRACGLALGAECCAPGPGGARSAPAVSLSLDSRSSRRPSCLPAYLTYAVSPPGLQRWRAPSETRSVLWGRGVGGIPCAKQLS